MSKCPMCYGTGVRDNPTGKCLVCQGAGEYYTIKKLVFRLLKSEGGIFAAR